MYVDVCIMCYMCNLYLYVYMLHCNCVAIFKCIIVRKNYVATSRKASSNMMGTYLKIHENENNSNNNKNSCCVCAF